MAEEFRQHLDALIERNIAAGMSHEEARNAAFRQFGGVEQIKEAAREQRVWMWASLSVLRRRHRVTANMKLMASEIYICPRDEFRFADSQTAIGQKPHEVGAIFRLPRAGRADLFYEPQELFSRR